jgi:hypothetical protein
MSRWEAISGPPKCSTALGGLPQSIRVAISAPLYQPMLWGPSDHWNPPLVLNGARTPARHRHAESGSRCFSGILAESFVKTERCLLARLAPTRMVLSVPYFDPPDSEPCGTLRDTVVPDLDPCVVSFGRAGGLA